MSNSNSEKLLSLVDLTSRRIEKVSVPSLRGYVYVREMTAKSLLDYGAEFHTVDEKGEVTIKPGKQSDAALAMVQLTLCDEDGNLLIPPGKKGLDQLAELKGAVLLAIQQKANELNGLGQEEELRKN